MTDAIIGVLGWINDWILGLAADNSALTSSLKDFSPALHSFTSTVMTSVVMPVAYVILALFFMLELYNASVKTDGGSSGVNLGAERVFQILFKLALCKFAVDNTKLILNAIYQTSTNLTTGIQGVLTTGGTSVPIDTAALKTSIDALGFWSQLVALILCFIVFLIIMVAVALANVIVITRFVELFVYLAISPIPIATLPNEEFSQVGKNFLKNFVAVSIQGTLIFLVLAFFPVLLSAGLMSSSGDTDLFAALVGAIGYAVVLILAVFSTSKWAKSITNAM